MTGTLIRKTEPHQKCESSSPPSTGPVATPMPTAVAQRPIARGRSAGSNTLEMIDSVCGMTAAPPNPMAARAAMSWAGECAEADSSDAMPNSASRRLRPNLSPITPKVNSRPAKTRV